VIGSRARRRNLVAFLGSFAVYAIPLPGPHAVPLLGTWLAGAFTGSSRSLWLGAATSVLAILAQAITFLLLRWVLGGRWRWLVLPPFGTALVALVYVMTVLVIPRWALIDRDAAPENLAWPAVCTVPAAAVEAVRSPPEGDLARAGQAWVRVGKDGSRHGLLAAASCAVAEIGGPPPRGTMHAITYAVAGGATLETTWDMPAQQQVAWWRRSPGSAAVELPASTVHADSVPILSRDGSWLAVVERPEPPPAMPHLALTHLADGVSHEVSLEALGRGTFVVLSATVASDATSDLVSGEVLLCRSEDELVAVDLAGNVTFGPFRPPSGGVDPGSLTQRRVGSGGWVAWDAYVESRPYTIAWDTPAGRGSHVVPKGRGITSADVDPDGRWIALSTSSIYSLGGVHDDVIVLDAAAGGREVFRDCLPTYTRSDVAFVGPGLLAYTAWDGGPATEVHVVRAP
jgi:hypothetical protein